MIGGRGARWAWARSAVLSSAHAVSAVVRSALACSDACDCAACLLGSHRPCLPPFQEVGEAPKLRAKGAGNLPSEE